MKQNNFACRTILLDKLEERKNRNPKYSLRAYAKDLKISPGQLSEVLSGKRNLSPDRAKRIALLLGLSPLTAKDFVDLAEVSTKGVASLKISAKSRVESRTNPDELLNVSRDESTFFHDWKNLAIWTYITLPTYDGTSQSIAHHFDLNLIEVEDVLRKLSRLKLISVNGKIKPSGSNLAYTGGTGPNSDLKILHRQIADLGKNSIVLANYNTRHVESAMFTIDSSKYGEVSQKIANFCRSLVKDYAEDKTCDSVYGLSLQFFKM